MKEKNPNILSWCLHLHGYMQDTAEIVIDAVSSMNCSNILWKNVNFSIKNITILIKGSKMEAKGVVGDKVPKST